MDAIFRIVYLILCGAVGALDMRIKHHNPIATMRSAFDSAKILPIPLADNVYDRYCHTDISGPGHLRVVRYSSLLSYNDGADDEKRPSASRLEALYGQCEEDSDCDSGRPYCVDSVCRECSGPGNELAECGSSTKICSEETNYTCSECVSDEDCPRSQNCRSEFDQSVYASFGGYSPRKCVACKSPPPGFAEIINPATCDWRCPLDTYISETGCSVCPTCGEGQFYGPSLTPSSFLTTCTNATSVQCLDCEKVAGVPISDPNFCAVIKSPGDSFLAGGASLSVGDLGASMPCRYFECKQSWFLDLSVNKCKKCHFSMCSPGNTLSGCGDSSPGACTSCVHAKPPNGVWIDPNDPSQANLTDTCKFTCPAGMTFDSAANDCVRCSSRRGAAEGTPCAQGVVYDAVEA